MSKFWSVATVLFVTALALMASANGPDRGISFSDLETECRYDKDSDMNIGLEGQKLVFNGYFPVKSTEADLNSKYSVDGDEITLNIKVSNSEEPSSFWNKCYGTAVYDAKTSKLQKGSYTVTVMHDDKVADKRVIRIN